MTQTEKGARFRELHDGPDVLVLANAWDVQSAKVVARAGHAAVATSSAAVARSLGYEDGEQTPVEEMIEAVRRMAKAVDVPLTADLEAGYGATPDAVALTTALAITAGAVGMNLEDSWHGGDKPLREISDQAERVAAAVGAAEAAAMPFVVNARIDVFLGRVGEEAGRLDETTRRAAAYLEAGAGSIFVPGVVDAPTISALVSAIDGPLNVLVMPGLPPVAELGKLGVRRVSLGSWPHHAAMVLLERLATSLVTKGTWEELDLPG